MLRAHISLFALVPTVQNASSLTFVFAPKPLLDSIESLRQVRVERRFGCNSCWFFFFRFVSSAGDLTELSPRLFCKCCLLDSRYVNLGQSFVQNENPNRRFVFCAHRWISGFFFFAIRFSRFICTILNAAFPSTTYVRTWPRSRKGVGNKMRNKASFRCSPRSTSQFFGHTLVRFSVLTRLRACGRRTRRPAEVGGKAHLCGG